MSENTNSITTELTEKLQKSHGAPFLFLGSGFSRRYVNLEIWPELLKNFCVGIRDYKYYETSAGGDLPLTAKLIADDFHEYWWASDT